MIGIVIRVIASLLSIAAWVWYLTWGKWEQASPMVRTFALCWFLLAGMVIWGANW